MSLMHKPRFDLLWEMSWHSDFVFYWQLVSGITQKISNSENETWQNYPIKYQSCTHIRTSQLICYANQLTGFYMGVTLAFNGLIRFSFCNPPSTKIKCLEEFQKMIFKKIFARLSWKMNTIISILHKMFPLFYYLMV